MIDDISNQLAGRGFRLHPRDELAAGRADHLDLDLGKALVEFPDDFLLDLGVVRGVENQLALALGGPDQLRRAEILFGLHRQAAERKTEAYAGHCGQIFPLHERTLPPFSYLIRCATPPCAALRASQFAPPIRTPSRTVCTRLNAAVLPTLPPS